VLDHASQSFGFGGKLASTPPASGRTKASRAWPEVLQMRPDVVARIDAIWKDLGL